MVVSGPSTPGAGVPVTITASATAPGQPDTDVTSETSFTIAPAGRRSGASCTANSCGASRAGAYTVTGRFAGASGTASLTVTAVTTTAGFLRDARTGRPIKRSCVALRSKATNRTFIIRVDFGRWSLRTYDPGPFHLAFYVIDNKRCAAPELSDRYLPSWYQNQPFTSADPRTAAPPRGATAVTAGRTGLVACLAPGALPTKCAVPHTRFSGRVAG